MRIRELLEGKKFNDNDFVKTENGQRDIDYDLAEDLVYFINNNDDVYRRQLYPAIARHLNAKKSLSPSLFKSVIADSYQLYRKEYPIRELPASLDSETCQEACEKLHDEIDKAIQEGKLGN